MAFQITLHQMAMFFLVLAVGFAAGKARVIEEDYLPKFAKLITTVFLPVMIFAYTRNGSTRDALLARWPIVVFALVWYAVITFGLLEHAILSRELSIALVPTYEKRRKSVSFEAVNARAGSCHVPRRARATREGSGNGWETR